MHNRGKERDAEHDRPNDDLEAVQRYGAVVVRENVSKEALGFRCGTEREQLLLQGIAARLQKNELLLIVVLILGESTGFVAP